MFRTLRSRAILLALVIALSVPAFPASAFAALGSSPTNPWDDADPSVFWRMGWGNALYPQFNLYTTPPSTGMLYRVDRNLLTDIDESNPAAYDHSYWYPDATESGTWRTHTLDMRGILASNPGGLASLDPGARLPIEGRWFYHWNFFDVSAISTQTVTAQFNVDVTPPRPVAKLTAKPFLGYAGPANVWLPDTRAVISWEDKEYDDLAGTAAYEVWLNGSRLMDPASEDRPRYVWHTDYTFTTITLEDLEPGKNKISVKAVDRATNTSTPQTVFFYSDPDTPTVSITAPSKAGSLIGARYTFKADAFDGAGLQWVKFFIDNSLAYTDTASPYAVQLDMRPFSNGTHTLKVVAKDMYGREVVDTRTFSLDRTVPSLTSVGDSPDPFYPYLIDGYKDTNSIKYWVSEPVTAHLYIYTPEGDVYRHLSGARSAGWNSFSWDGTDAEGFLPGTGVPNATSVTFGYRIGVVDAAGNTRWSGVGTTTIRDYEIIRLANNAVKIVPR